ncbi:hypothetical protein CMV37_29735, partial [Bacillus cereus]
IKYYFFLVSRTLDHIAAIKVNARKLLIEFNPSLKVNKYILNIYKNIIMLIILLKVNFSITSSIL